MDFSQLDLGNSEGFEEWPYYYLIKTKIFHVGKNGVKPLCICNYDEKTKEPIYASMKKRYGFLQGHFATCPNNSENVALEVEDITKAVMKKSATFDNLALRIPICYQKNHTIFQDGEEEEEDDEEGGASLEDCNQNNMCLTNYGQGLMIFTPKSGEYKGQLCAKCCYCSQKSTFNQGLFPLGNIEENQEFLYTPEEIENDKNLKDKIAAKVDSWWKKQAMEKAKTTKSLKGRIIPKKKKKNTEGESIDSIITEGGEVEDEEEEEVTMEPVPKKLKKIHTGAKLGLNKLGGFKKNKS